MVWFVKIMNHLSEFVECSARICVSVGMYETFMCTSAYALCLRCVKARAHVLLAFLNSIGFRLTEV